MNVCEALPALAVRVAVCALATEVTLAVNPALIAPAGIVTEPGTVTVLLLLDRLTKNPPLAAAELRVTVQASVPAPVNEPVAQANALRTGTPIPLRPTMLDVPVEELLLSVSWPAAAPVTVGANWTVTVAV